MYKATSTELIITDEILEQDLEDILKGLREYNLEKFEDKNPQDLGIYLNDEKGCKLAGLTGETHGNWLEIEFLWVSEKLRGQGIGCSIVKKAEQIARERGCKFVFLNTYAFQAPEFYKKMGYKEIFVLEDCPRTGKRYYLTKNLIS